ncbi:MAG: hypothetical protein ACI86H_000494 [bacterium]|jgi:hypothetical protein
MSKAEDLLNAQLEFELSTINPDNIKSTLETELNSLYKNLEDISLHQILSQNDITNIIHRVLIEHPIKDEFIELLKLCSKETHQILNSSQIKPELFISKENFDELIHVVLGMENLRKEVVHQVVTSPFYSKMVSDLMYREIKNFMSSNSAITQKLPGASRLLGIGKKLVKKNLPQLEESIERKVIDFINTNVSSAIKNSEKFINQSINSSSLSKELSDEIWKQLNDQQFEELKEYFTTENISSLTIIIKKIWDEFRKKELFQTIIEGWSKTIFENYQDKKLSEFVEMLGLSKESFIQEAIELITPIGLNPVIQDIIKERLQIRLEAFYKSEIAQNILS